MMLKSLSQKNLSVSNKIHIIIVERNHVMKLNLLIFPKFSALRGCVAPSKLYLRTSVCSFDPHFDGLIQDQTENSSILNMNEIELNKIIWFIMAPGVYDTTKEQFVSGLWAHISPSGWICWLRSGWCWKKKLLNYTETQRIYGRSGGCHTACLGNTRMFRGFCSVGQPLEAASSAGKPWLPPSM